MYGNSNGDEDNNEWDCERSGWRGLKFSKLRPIFWQIFEVNRMVIYLFFMWGPDFLALWERFQIPQTKIFKITKKKSGKERSWKLGTQNTERRHQSTKMIFQGNSVKILIKNNFTDFGFSDFFTIYKRGNRNW